MRKAVWILAGVAIAAVLVVGLLQASDDQPAGTPEESLPLEDALAQLDGSPAPLAKLHEQANELLAGDGFEKTLASLKGHPVVINRWGSWCGPCRAEFPVFQRVAADKGTTVAFLGVNGQDSTSGAEEFLDEFPLSYPSFVDRGRQPIAQSLGVGAAFPTTVFVDRDGEIEIVLSKPYRNEAELEADIKRYLKA